jgi:hypothetical protein
MVGSSGISSGFPLLFRTPGQVAHVLRTRSPLSLPRSCDRLGPVRLACIKHAASVRPEPGSNSPSRPRGGVIRRSIRRAGTGLTPLPTRHQDNVVRCQCKLTSWPPTRDDAASPRSPALAFGCSSSVLKERRLGTLPCGRRCLCAREQHRLSGCGSPAPSGGDCTALPVAARPEYPPSEASRYLSTA